MLDGLFVLLHPSVGVSQFACIFGLCDSIVKECADRKSLGGKYGDAMSLELPLKKKG